ncbi:cytochrome c oxidase assembly protein COX19-like [Hydractinia symbiolongicarpus]|uniref:cytochrome c oxidase assembly protein COX19-like n=1 Tax=Hydractinia symbiolongicarpus TaxID=13093 RepID=UPI00254AA801|nr:cytochrome c oxidase assembly protein COX19-like [Hydractinia symbiolongicarpus]
MNPGQKIFKPTAPYKGSFPLDHEGECKEFMVRYMKCLKKNKQSNFVCQKESKDYLQCRMEKGLMAEEDFKKLGFKTDEKNP